MVIVEVILARRKLAAANGGHSAVVDLHVIFAEARKALRSPWAKAFS